MSTRGALGFRLNGEDKITYNHSDSYPSWLGREVVKWCRRSRNWDSLKKKVSRMGDVSKRAPTQKEIEKLVKWTNTGVGDASEQDWYCLLRETQGDLTQILRARLFNGHSEFLDDSLFCEWAYIINLDSMELEIYKGYQKVPHRLGRYGQGKLIDGYAPVALVGVFPLMDIPKNWLQQVEPEEESK